MYASSGIYAAIVSSILSSVGIVIHAETVRLLGPLAVCAFASLLGSALLFAYFRLTNTLPSQSELKENFKSLLILTVLRSVAGALLFVYALSLTSSIKAMFFTKAEPYFVVFWSWLFGRGGLSRKHILLLLLHVAAAITLSTGGDLSLGKGQLGDLFVLAAMACSSLSYIVGKDVTRRIGARVTNAVTQLFGAVMLIPFALVLTPDSAWDISNPGWALLVLQVLMFNIIALTLWFYAIKSVDGWVVSALRAVGPLVAAPIAWVFFGQSLSALQVAAGALVLSTSALIAREHLVNTSKAAL